jgi:hypothetical protein
MRKERLMETTVTVVTEEDGHIICLATLNAEIVEGEDGPKQFRITPLAGQEVHEVSVPEELLTLAPRELAARCRVLGGKLLEDTKGAGI